ncbi:hypothetical protein [Nonomuraea sp. NPDC005692]|uniref:hypothetical protein n=1 Tax=Nonomuraea sp. NPDC005692 TaxID=3157168 RepID=UPI0034073893
MAQIIKAFLDPQKISRYFNGIVDVEDISAEWRVVELSASGEIWSESAPNLIALDPTRCDQALIKYELWDGEPPTSNWDESRLGTVHLTSGKVAAISSWSGDTTYNDEFDLGRRDQDWRFEVHRKFLSHEDFTTDIISLVLYKVQFWSPAEIEHQSAETNPHAR